MGWRRYRARNLRKELKLAAAKVAAQERERAAAVLSRPTHANATVFTLACQFDLLLCARLAVPAPR